MTQLLEINAERGSGRLEPAIDRYADLYSTDPSKNQAIAFARQATPKQLHDAGYRDGLQGWQCGSMSDYPDYQEGWSKGYADRRSSQSQGA
jgi:hypothetical protein